MISGDGDRRTDDLSGEWPRGEKLDLEPAPPPKDWLQEFAAECPEPAQAPPSEPRGAAVRAVRRGRRHFRLPLILLAAGIAFVALVEVLGLQHRRLWSCHRRTSARLPHSWRRCGTMSVRCRRPRSKPARNRAWSLRHGRDRSHLSHEM